MADLLFEIGVEEIPASYLQPAIESWAASVGRDLSPFAAPGSAPDSLLWTPRRLTIIWRGLAAETAKSSEVVMGPPARIAWEGGTPLGAPTQALVGFCRKVGVEPGSVTLQKGGKEPVATVVRTIAAVKLSDELIRLAPKWIADIPFPKSMVWNESGVRFARPIRWLAVCLDEQVIAVQTAGITAGCISYGHRQVAEISVPVTTANYAEALQRIRVEVDPEVRRQRILSGIKEIEEEYAVTVDVNPDLLAEVINICEWPKMLVGKFSTDYLDLPEEVVRAPLTKHQRYFAVRKQAKLTNLFVFATNSLTDNVSVVIEGNQRVLEARLRDARFFWDEDRKQPLESRCQRLSGIIYHAELGTYADKISREQNAGELLAPLLGVSGSELARATQLAYADLVTDMVFEFPELAGIMGRYYAACDGEPGAVVAALEEGQKPRFAEDELPATPLGYARALTARLEALASFFSAGITPTGSKDPYALRRSAIALNRLLVARPEVNVESVLRVLIDQSAGSGDDVRKAEILELISQFLAVRQEKEAARSGIPTATIRATTTILPLRPGLALARARALERCRESGNLEPLLDNYKRLQNILSKDDNLAGTDLSGESAGSIADRLRTGVAAGPEAAALGRATIAALPDEMAVEDEAGLDSWLARFAFVGEQLSHYFDTILVLDADSERRQANLRFLLAVRDVFLRFAAFDQMVY